MPRQRIFDEDDVLEEMSVYRGRTAKEITRSMDEPDNREATIRAYLKRMEIAGLVISKLERRNAHSEYISVRWYKVEIAMED